MDTIFPVAGSSTEPRKVSSPSSYIISERFPKDQSVFGGGVYSKGSTVVTFFNLDSFD